MMATTRQKNNTGAHEEGAGEAGERLKEYREQLRRLQQATEAVTSLRERAVSLEARLKELSVEAAGLLDGDEVERESALITTLGVIEAKLSRARQRLSQAEAGLEAQKQAVRGEFSRLFLIFKLHRVEVEKRRLQGQMVAGCSNLSLEQVCLHLKTIASLQQLEITAQDVAGLLGQAEKLLGAVAADSDFNVPPAMSSASEKVARAPLPERLYGPYLFRGMDEREIAAELSWIRTSEPGMDMAGATRRLAETHPELFSTEAEVRQMINEPLEGLNTGVYEEQKGGGYKLFVEPIGPTTVENNATFPIINRARATPT
jgi:hypothetical protein